MHLKPMGPAATFAALLGGYSEKEVMTWAFIVDEFKAEPATESQ